MLLKYLLNIIKSQAADVVPQVKVVAKNMPWSSTEGTQLKKMTNRPH
jgi:hypothetical protein